MLVHGWFTDASSWAPVAAQLQRAGVRVVLPANPLRGLSADAAYLKDRMEEGPVLLVGHSYGAAVITEAAAQASNVRGLVYVAGFALDAGESIESFSAGFPDPPMREALRRRDFDGHTELTIDPARFGPVFAQDLPAGTTSLMGAAQRPVATSCLAERATAAAWHRLPSWYLVASDDRCVHPEAQRFMAGRAGSHIACTAGSHAVTLSQPTAVTDLILTAAQVIQLSN